MTPVAWVNMNVFDYTGRLQQGSQTLYSWPIEAELGDSVNYMGPTVLNSSSSECVCLEVEITELPLPPSSRSKVVVFPPLEEIRRFAHEVSQVATPAVSQTQSPTVLHNSWLPFPAHGHATLSISSASVYKVIDWLKQMLQVVEVDLLPRAIRHRVYSHQCILVFHLLP